MNIKRKTTVFILVAFALALNSGQAAPVVPVDPGGDHVTDAPDDNGSDQPYENGFTAVQQGGSQCGPAAFYMIFNHYQDHALYKTSDCSGVIDLSAELAEVSADTEICQYINGGWASGTSWSQLEAAADGLYDYGTCTRHYASELNDDFTDYNDAADEQERRDRLDYIKANYLDNNRPVIIHLKRFWPLSGHYIVVTGYDDTAGVVYYADPNGAVTGNVDYTSFIEEKWYIKPGQASYMVARWDGEWMGFY